MCFFADSCSQSNGCVIDITNKIHKIAYNFEKYAGVVWVSVRFHGSLS
jgi:hypothetical protein